MSSQKIPLVALIGLPNAGKSSLINRLGEKKSAIVAREAHTTRDLNYGEVQWDGNYFRIVDTGGLVPDPEDSIQKQVQIRSWGAIAEADLLVWVIERKQNVDTISDKIIHKIWKSGKPYLVVVNKIDDPNQDKSIADYARLGGNGFLNICCNNGYNLGELCDMIVEELQNQGFGEIIKKPIDNQDTEVHLKKRQQTMKGVQRGMDGTYIVRNLDGIYESVKEAEYEIESNRIDNIIFDWYGVIFNDAIDQVMSKITKENNLTKEQQEIFRRNYIENCEYKDEDAQSDFSKFGVNMTVGEFKQLWNSITTENQEVTDFLKYQKSLGKNVYYLTNIGNSLEERKKSDIYKYFDGGIASCEIGSQKPDESIYRELIKKYDLDASKSFFIDDREENVETAIGLNMKGVHYQEGKTDLYKEIKKAESKTANTPKVLFLGKPNVGKSSLFNKMAGKNMQIVTDIAGTTLSVNDTLIKRNTTKQIIVPILKDPEEGEFEIDEKNSNN